MTIQSANLKGWWKLDDTELFDNTNWSIENQVYPSNWESALNFDATQNDYVETSYTGNVTSLSLWFKPDNTITTSTSADCLVGFQDGGNFAGIYLGSYTGSISNELITIKTTASSNASYYSQLGGTINTDWHHLVIVGTGTQYNIYLDNVNVFTGNLGGDVALINASRLDVGCRILSSSVTIPFPGKISNVAVFDTELDDAAVSSIYNNGTPETNISNSPVSWWKLDNLTTGLQDSGSGGNNATNNGTTVANTFVNTESAQVQE